MEPSRSRYQEKIIKNYYRNLDAIALQKAMEQVTELYLCEGKKREQTWKRLIANLEKLGMSASQIQHLQEQNNPELIAEAQGKAFQRWAEAFTRVSLDAADLPPLTAGLCHQGLIVHDAGDRVVSLAQSRALHSAWSNSTLVITEGLGHRRILSDPEAIATIVGFLEIER